MSENQNKEIIATLERMNTLLQENLKLKQYIDRGCAEETAEKIREVKADLSVLPGVPSVCNNFPVFPLTSDHYKKADGDKAHWFRLFAGVGIITGVLLLIVFITGTWGFIRTLSTVGAIATIVIGLLFFSARKDSLKKHKEYDDSVVLYNSTLAKFRSALSSYEQDVINGLDAAETYGKQYQNIYAHFRDCIADYEKNKYDSMQKFISNMEEVQSHDFLPDEYYHLIPKMITMLKSGRADDYKEALNMAITEEREEAAEAARRAEEARRTEILRQQAAEEARHNQAMERQQEEHNRQMAEAEKNRAREEQRARREAFQADAKARSAAMQRCMKCVKQDACGNAKGNPNCGAFVPKY